MDKIDLQLIERLRESRVCAGVVKALEKEEFAYGIVRVSNPIYLSRVERKFEVVGSYPFISSVAVKIGLEEAIRLARMEEVEYVSGESAVFALDDERAFADAGALQVKSDLDGRGVTLCVMDTGVAPHLDLSVPKERIVHFADVINGETLPYDDNGHGTFVAGVAAGNGNLSARGVVGVAPMANVVGLKAIGKSGESGALKILDGMQWLFDNFRQYGIKVACMSFGAEPQPIADPLKMGVEMLARSGLIVVAASGNSGKNSLRSPAISPEVIAVGAVDGKDEIASFTSRGTYQGVFRPDVYADGVNVRGVSVGGTYSLMSGTSAAAPYVAGACCLLCQKYRNITPRQAKAAILASSYAANGARILRI